MLIGLIGGNAVTTLRAQARNDAERVKPRTWEYCSATQGSPRAQGGKAVSVFVIEYYRETGLQREEIEGANPSEAAAKGIAKLGDEGWEEVNVASGNYGDSHFSSSYASYYFKRLK